MSEPKKSGIRRVLVTGATGFIGKHVCRVLATRGFDVFAPSRSSNANEKTWSLYNSLTENKLLLKKVDAVVHLAAYIPKNHNDLDEALPCYMTNSLGTLNLLRAAERANVSQFIFASTCAIYTPTSGIASEESATIPVRASPYLASKLAAETYVAASSFGHKLVTTTLRFSSVYGAGMANEGLLSDCVHQLRTHGTFTVSDGNRYKTDFVYVNDVVESIYSALKYSVQGTFNIASGQSITPYEVATTVASSLGIPSSGIDVAPTTKSPVPCYGILNIDKARTHLFYRPTKFSDGVVSYIDSLK